jgi:hypothetical protein
MEGLDRALYYYDVVLLMVHHSDFLLALKD